MTTYTNDFSGALGGTSVRGGASITAGKLGFAPNAGDSLWVAGNASGADQFAQCVVDTTAGGGAIGPAVRAGSSTPLNLYYAAIDNNGTGEIGKVVAGVRTQLTSSGFGGFANGDTFRLEAVGTSLKLYRNGSTTASLSTTDSALSGGGVGVAGNVFEFGGSTNFADNFTGGDIGGGGGGTTGTAANTFGALTSAAAGRTVATGTAANTLAPLTSAAAGRTVATATAANTLAPLTSVAAGRPYYTGTAANTLGALTSAAAGRTVATATAANTLAPLTSNGQGQTGGGPTPIVGTAANVLASLVSVAAGRPIITGAGIAVLAPVTSNANATVTVTGAGAVVLAALISNGTNTPPPAPPPENRWVAQLACENEVLLGHGYR